MRRRFHSGLGRGAYLGPDFSIQYLHNLTLDVADTQSAQRYGDAFGSVAMQVLLRLLNDLLEDYGLIVSRVPCAIDKCHPPTRDLLSQRVQPRRLLAKLEPIAFAKFVPSSRVMAEPLAKLGARRQLAQPIIESGIPLLDTARPDAIHQHAITIGQCRRVVDPLYLNFASLCRRHLQFMHQTWWRAVRMRAFEMPLYCLGRDSTLAWCSHIVYCSIGQLVARNTPITAKRTPSPTVTIQSGFTA